MIVSAFLRSTKVKQAKVYFRVRDEGCDLKAASELRINPDYWSQERQGYKTRVTLVSDEERLEFNAAVRDITILLSKTYFKGADGEWMRRTIFAYHHPDAYKLERNGEIVETRLSVLVEQYIQAKGFEKRQACSVRSIVGKLERFENYRHHVLHRNNYKMNVDTATANDLREFYDFLVHEHEYRELYPDLYVGASRAATLERSDNTLHSTFARLRTVCKWCINRGITTNYPFANFEMPTQLYGTPFFITIEERNRVYELDLSDAPHLAMFRDVFVFQCSIGCRFGDLMRLQPGNVIDGVLEYVPHKTINRVAKVLRVPLNAKAMEIYDRYKDRSTIALFPRYNVTDYNRGVREVLQRAGIDRVVTIIDPVSRKERQQRLCDIATSHMARRTFIGNMYKQVKDPNLISSMSGHANGSRAFARYRTIDDEMKIELIKMIE